MSKTYEIIYLTHFNRRSLRPGRTRDNECGAGATRAGVGYRAPNFRPSASTGELWLILEIPIERQKRTKSCTGPTLIGDLSVQVARAITNMVTFQRGVVWGISHRISHTRLRHVNYGKFLKFQLSVKNVRNSLPDPL